MFRQILKSKIHRVAVTETNLNYEGSVTIDKVLLKAADILPGERVQIVNLNNGSRVETYVLEADENSGVVCMNGAAARWAEPGDKVIIISYQLMEREAAIHWMPKIVRVDKGNKLV